MRRVVLCIFVMARIALFSFDIAEGEVSYLSFTQGNPGIPGDGITISSLPLSGFVVSPSFPFTEVRNGITFSAFFRDTRPGVDVTDIKLDLGLAGRPPVPCGILLGVGSPSPPVLTPPVNGVRGIAISFSQEQLDALLVPLRQAPECADLTVDDFYLGNVLFFKGSGFGPILDLDAFAVGFGVNIFPPDTTPHITAISPASGPAGTLITITGENFGNTQGISIVTFGTARATIPSWGDTQLKSRSLY